VFWVEAFNEAAKKWVAIDPVVTKSLAKPSKFEPPASDPLNLMNYVVGFEDDASARDLTRRYVKAYNAKTRKLRVESTRHGEKWWEKALGAYEKPFFEDRDEVEISELTSKAAAEPMPRSIQDFKDHPVYALERHVRRNEVIHPKRVIGHVGLGKTAARNETSEPVYRRADLHVVRSADKWYRLGRDVKVGEQPLKRIAATRTQGGSMSDDEDENEPGETTLYAEFQTEVYVPPPVVNGRVPKNTYGNLDIYVPSMVPPGGVHIKRPEAAKAARILGIDYSDAVTGFDFKGRRGTAVLGGIVIALDYKEAIEEVIEGLEDERRHAALEARSAEALRFWRLFLVKLRIAERVKEYAGEEEENEVEDEEVDFEDSGGGFFPESDRPTASPPPRVLGKQKMSKDYHDPEDHIESGPESAENDDDTGGGFILDGEDENEPVRAPAEQSKTMPLAIPQSLGSQSAPRTKAANKPRYSLVVVPTHQTSPESQDRRLTPETKTKADIPGSSENVPIAVDSSTNGDSKSTSVVTVSRPPSPSQSQRQPSMPKYDTDSEIEKGSLLSEDPDDEDAIPEWLMSDED
jgi:xeroderma pigmentosum group C-complementing protein